MNSSRQTFRKILQGTDPVILPVAYDAISALLVKTAGFDAALISGNVSAAATFGFPDIGLVSMTEMAQVVRQIYRAAPLGYLVDGESGFGNAHNTARTVVEFEAAGASALMIEDTDMPQRFGTTEKSIVSCEEMCGKLRSALAARQDQSLVIVGRSDALQPHGLAETIERVRAYTATGVDAIFVPAAKTRSELLAIRQATDLPLLAVGLPEDNISSGLALLAECGVAMTVTSTFPFQIAVQAMHDALGEMKNSGEFSGLVPHACSRAFLDELLSSNKH